MRHAVFMVRWILPTYQALLKERVEDAIDDVVHDEGERNQDWTTTVIILPHENDLVDPEENHEAALKSDESCDRFRRSLMFAVAHYGSDQESNGGDHRDERQDELSCTIAFLLVVDFVAAWALGDACVFMEIEAGDACQAVVGGALARVTRF